MVKQKRRRAKRAPAVYDPTPSIYGATRVVTDIAIASAVLKGVAGVARSL